MSQEFCGACGGVLRARRSDATPMGQPARAGCCLHPNPQVLADCRRPDRGEFEPRRWRAAGLWLAKVSRTSPMLPGIPMGWRAVNAPRGRCNRYLEIRHHGREGRFGPGAHVSGALRPACESGKVCPTHPLRLRGSPGIVDVPRGTSLKIRPAVGRWVDDDRHAAGG